MPNWTVFPDETPSKPAVALAEQIERDGGHALAVYREPVGDHWQIFCLLPMAKVEPTPYQRDLSPTHVKRLLAVVKKIDRFVDMPEMQMAGAQTGIIELDVLIFRIKAVALSSPVSRSASAAPPG